MSSSLFNPFLKSIEKEIRSKNLIEISVIDNKNILSSRYWHYETFVLELNQTESNTHNITHNTSD